MLAATCSPEAREKVTNVDHDRLVLMEIPRGRRDNAV
jgi:hypothetical protein